MRFAIGKSTQELAFYSYLFPHINTRDFLSYLTLNKLILLYFRRVAVILISYNFARIYFIVVGQAQQETWGAFLTAEYDYQLNKNYPTSRSQWGLLNTP